MKKLTLAALIFFSSCLQKTKDYMAPEVEQKIVKSQILCASGTCLGTYAWYKNEIAASWYDDVKTLTDSVVMLRQRQADSVISTLKLSK